MSIIGALTGSKLVGFLTLHETQNGGYLGSYLITDLKGMPKEFRCTHSVKPDALQKSLYGENILPYIGVELCGRPLLRSSKNRPRLLLVDKKYLLRLADHTPHPVVYVRRIEETSYIEEHGAEYSVDQMDLYNDSSRKVEVVRKVDKKTETADLIRRLCLELDPTEPFRRMAGAVESLTQQSPRFR